MTDVFTPAKRSRVMSRVRGRDTTPELLVRSHVHRMGFRFRIHYRELPGTPDLVLPRHGKVIFVHGCFWHGHTSCKRSKRPETNVEFWNKKLDANIERDTQVLRALRAFGWKVLIIWQCETSNVDKLSVKLENFLHGV